MRLATESKDDSPEDAARMALVAAAVVILIYCPLRLTNLAQLLIGENLVYGLGGSSREAFRAPPSDKKRQGSTVAARPRGRAVGAAVYSRFSPNPD